MPVYKQPNSRNWLIEFKVDGRRYRRSSGTTVKRKAIRLEEKWRQEIHDGKHHIGKAQSLTIEEAADRYYLTVIRPNNSREKSKYAEKCCLNVIVRYFSPKTGLNAIQSGDIARWRDTMLSNGARLSEALDLRWDNVDLDGANKASITLMRTKNGVPRRIPLTSRAKNLLLQLRACRIDLDKPVFLYQAPGTSEPVPFRNPFGSWKTALRDAGMDNSLRIANAISVAFQKNESLMRQKTVWSFTTCTQSHRFTPL